MSKSRLFSLFVIVALIAVAVLLVQRGITTSEVAARQNAILDQHERHPGFINQSVSDNLKAAAAAEQARLEFRRGEWNLDHSSSPVEFDVEQARLGWRAGK